MYCLLRSASLTFGLCHVRLGYAHLQRYHQNHALTIPPSDKSEEEAKPVPKPVIRKKWEGEDEDDEVAVGPFTPNKRYSSRLSSLIGTNHQKKKTHLSQMQPRHARKVH